MEIEAAFKTLCCFKKWNNEQSPPQKFVSQLQSCSAASFGFIDPWRWEQYL